MSVWSILARKAKGIMLRHGPMMMTCEAFESFILDYLSGDLPPAKRRMFELHIKICRECREYLAAYRESLAMGKAAFTAASEPVPPEVPEDLVRAILAARSAD